MTINKRKNSKNKMKKVCDSIIGFLFIILSILSFSYYISLKIFGGYITFSKFWLAVGSVGILVGVYFIFKKPNALILGKHHKIRITLAAVFLIGIIIFSILEALIIYNASTIDKGKEDYIVILGAGVRGTKLSMALHDRLLTAVDYANSNPNAKIVVSGGQGPGEDISEAEAMKRFLLSNGIEEDSIIMEDKSTSTYENFKFTKVVLNKMDKRENIKIRIVTNNFHMFRSKMLAERNGFTAYGLPAKLHPLLVPNYYVREVFAFIKSYVFDI